MVGFYVVKRDLNGGVKHYETATGKFSKNIDEAHVFSKKTAEKHVELTVKYMNRFMAGRIAVTVEAAAEADNATLQF